MGVGQLSESDAVDALRLPFYSSSHPTGSHGWRNQFDLGNTSLLYITGQPIFNRRQGGAAGRIGGFRVLQQLPRFGLLGADTAGAQDALLSPIGNPGNGFSAWMEHASVASVSRSPKARGKAAVARSQS